ncbi:MAG: hypothetical protein AB8B55_03110 [Mariniblastus sp.]
MNLHLVCEFNVSPVLGWTPRFATAGKKTWSEPSKLSINRCSMATFKEEFTGKNGATENASGHGNETVMSL